MCFHPECSNCPYATANPLTAFAYFPPLSLVTHNNTRSQRNVEIHTYNVSKVLLILHHRALQCQVITINALHAALMRANVMCTERPNAKESDLLIGSSLGNPHLSLSSLR